MADPLNPIPSQVDGKFAVPSATEGVSGQAPGNFGAMMEGQGRTPFAQGTAGAGPTGMTPMDLAKTQGIQTGTPTFNSLLAQATTAQDSLGTVKDQLNYPNLKISKPQSSLLKRHLQDANEHINKAADTIGATKGPQATGAGTLAHFLSWVTQGQDTMMSVQGQLQQMAKSPDSINPADMMLAQSKMNQAQNEIQFSTTLLGKMIDSIKQLMSTQL